MSRDFRKLKAFSLADSLVLKIYHCTRHFPREEIFGLTNQMRRAAISVPANIAEGAGRSGLREFLNFLGIAMGSLSELSYHLELSCKLGYLGKKEYSALESLLLETSKTLQGLIQALKTKL